MKIGFFESGEGHFLFFATTQSGTRTRLCRTPEEAERLAEEVEAAGKAIASERKNRSIEAERCYLHRDAVLDAHGDWIAVESVEGYFILVKPPVQGSTVYLVFRHDGTPVRGRHETLEKAIAAAAADRAYGEGTAATPIGP
jgi:hypothetical protein